MTATTTPSSIWHRLALWAVPPCLVILFVWVGLGGSRWNARTPTAYSGDALFYLAQSKATIDHGWWWENPSIGLPSSYHALVFAQNTNVDQAVVWLVGRFTGDVALAVNVAWILMLALGAVTASWGLGRLGVSPIGAGAAGVLFALTPFVFYRNLAHLNLVIYLVPFPATAALLLATAAPGQRWRVTDLAVLLAGCLLVGFNYIYFAFFGSMLILAGTLIGYGRTQSGPLLKAGAACLGAIVVATALNLVPNLLAWREFGQPRGVQHAALESELFGLKIRHLVTPVSNSTWRPFRAWLDENAVAEFPLENENAYAKMGVVATAGFLGLLGVLIFPSAARIRPDGDAVLAAARLTAAALLVAIVGGLGAVFSVLVSSEIRAYNRISPFIVFFALAAVAVWIDRLSAARGRTVPTGAIWVLVLAIGLADQRQPLADLAADGPVIDRGYRRVTNFVSLLEGKLPQGAAVFQLPLRPFPVDSGIEWMKTYDHFRPYLSSRHLRWSYPVMTRDQAQWERGLGRVPQAQWPRRLAQEGFAAILVNRSGYQDRGQALLQELTEGPGGAAPLMQDQDFVALDLRHFQAASPVAR
jgi:phosphoglycerol transferase